MKSGHTNFRALLLGVVALTGAAASCASSAATLSPDALLCEAPEPFSVIDSERWTSVGATAQLRTAKLSAEYYTLGEKSAGVRESLATQEESIRADSSRRLASGSTVATAMAASEDKNSAASKAQRYNNIQRICASSGPSPLEAEILERKPITGLSRIRTVFKGSKSEFWTNSANVSQ